MEANDILSDQVQIRRPVLLELLRALSITVVADARDVVGQRVQPHVYHMLRIEVYRDSPFEGCPGYAQILQSRKQEVVHHLILP